MQSDAAQDVAARLDAAISGAAEVLGKRVDRHERPQRIRDVRVDSRTSVEDEAPERALRVQIGQVRASQQRVRREKEVEADQTAARPGHPANLRDRLLEVGKVSQPVADEYAIERAVGEGKTAGVRASGVAHAALTRQLQHALGEI